MNSNGKEAGEGEAKPGEMRPPYWSDGVERPEGESDTKRALRFRIACVFDGAASDLKVMNEWFRREIDAADRRESRYLRKAAGA